MKSLNDFGQSDFQPEPKLEWRQMEGKEFAVTCLELRKRAYANWKIDNSTLIAGAPMVFPCRECRAMIVLPEDYSPPRPQLCPECQQMKDRGWL